MKFPSFYHIMFKSKSVFVYIAACVIPGRRGFSMPNLLGQWDHSINFCVNSYKTKKQEFFGKKLTVFTNIVS